MTAHTLCLDDGVGPSASRFQPAPGETRASLDRAARRVPLPAGSGVSAVSAVYSLLECPPVPASAIVFARREFGRLKVLALGEVAHGAPTLNLAEIRRRGALLGANEIHVRPLAAARRQRAITSAARSNRGPGRAPGSQTD